MEIKKDMCCDEIGQCAQIIDTIQGSIVKTIMKAYVKITYHFGIAPLMPNLETDKLHDVHC